MRKFLIYSYFLMKNAMFLCACNKRTYNVFDLNTETFQERLISKMSGV